MDYAGNGSYDRIVPKFQKLVAARGGKDYYMRGTFTHANPDFTKDLFHMADDLGFTELSMERVVCAPDDPRRPDAGGHCDCKRSSTKSWPRTCSAGEKEGHPITFYHYMLDLTGGPCVYKRISGCGSGTEYMAVTPWGDLYPCHQFVGRGGLQAGRRVERRDQHRPCGEEFRACNAYARPDCADLLGQAVLLRRLRAPTPTHATGTIRGVYEAGCELFRKRIECAIMMKAAQEAGQ